MELGRSLNRAHEVRLIADYVGEEVSVEQARSVIGHAALFTEAIRAHIRNGVPRWWVTGPALVLSDAVRFNGPAGHSVLAMITSAGNPPWPLDCEIRNREAKGLPTPSKVRRKLFALDNRPLREALGHLA